MAPHTMTHFQHQGHMKTTDYNCYLLISYLLYFNLLYFTYLLLTLL